MKKEKVEIVFEVSKSYVEGLMALAEIGGEEERAKILAAMDVVRIDLDDKGNEIPTEAKASIVIIAIGSICKEL